MKKKITLIQILFLCIFIGSGIYLAKFHYDKVQTEKEMSSLREVVKESGRETAQPEIVEIDDDREEEVPERAENGMLAKYHTLYQQNNDMVGWIKIAGTAIDYPVVYNNNNNVYYLHRNFNKKKSAGGVPFMDYQCNLSDWSDNIIIYAHNMKNGTMFHDLLKYSSMAFWENHKEILFDTLYFKCKYEIFAVFRTSVGASDEFKYYEFINAESPREFDEFIAQCKANSLYDTKITPQYGETLLTLSTCSYNANNERFAVVARMTGKE